MYIYDVKNDDTIQLIKERLLPRNQRYQVEFAYYILGWIFYKETSVSLFPFNIILLNFD